jgi:cytochrome d ubiquinol oxidase subunit I
VPETLLGHLNSNMTVSGGIPIPGLASWLSDPATGKNTTIEGLTSFPEDQRPTVREVNTVHLAWDIMVGIATLLLLLAIWYGVYWLFRRNIPKTKWFLRAASIAGVAAIVAMEAGWVVTEVGRQPWIVRNYMLVEDAATGNTGVWVTFIVIAAIYAVVGVTTILVLRGMSRRWRAQGDAPESDVPYGPSAPADVDDEALVGAGEGGGDR